MKLTLLLPARPDDRWMMARQVGVTHAVTKAAAELSGLPAPDDLAALRAVRDRFNEAGIALVGLEGDQFDMSRIKWGTDGRDADIDRYHRMLRNMAELGIDLLCYNFMPRAKHSGFDWHRTQSDVPLRGGSLSTAFDVAKLPVADLELTTDQLWDNYRYFIEAVMPVAEQVGVRMALHPDDPPLPSLGGVARLFGNVAAFDKAFDLAPSPSNGVTFCQANFRLMGIDLASAVRHFADADRLFFVHIRDVDGTAERFVETWHDDGPTDMASMLRTYHDVGFEGPIRDDHVPLMLGEGSPDMPGYGTLGHIFAVGYLRGLMHGQGIPVS